MLEAVASEVLEVSDGPVTSVTSVTSSEVHEVNDVNDATHTHILQASDDMGPVAHALKATLLARLTLPLPSIMITSTTTTTNIDSNISYHHLLEYIAM